MVFNKRIGRLIDKAPAMSVLLEKMCDYIEEMEKINPKFPDVLCLYAKEGREILRFVNEE